MIHHNTSVLPAFIVDRYENCAGWSQMSACEIMYLLKDRVARVEDFVRSLLTATGVV